MTVRFHTHALERLSERGATKTEVEETVTSGESFPAKSGRSAFRRNFVYNSEWRGKFYASKQVEAIAVKEKDAWLVITVLVRFF